MALPTCECIGGLPQASKLDAIFCALSAINERLENQVSPQSYYATTTNAVAATIATIAIPSSITLMMVANVVARRTGGSAGTAEDGAGYTVSAVYKNVAGTATEIGETSIFSAEDQSGWTCTVTPSGSNALIQVTGAVNNNVSWIASVMTYSISS